MAKADPQKIDIAKINDVMIHEYNLKINLCAYVTAKIEENISIPAAIESFKETFNVNQTTDSLRQTYYRTIKKINND